jgi:hypothetical protein
VFSLFLIEPGDCEFENVERPMCDFWEPDSTTSPAAKFPNWRRHAGKTLSKDTGPSGDHTKPLKGKGMFIRISEITAFNVGHSSNSEQSSKAALTWKTYFRTGKFTCQRPGDHLS